MIAPASCRFFPASLLARYASEYSVRFLGQQAGLSESGSKLPHSKHSGSAGL
jgi:hypothetical protein